MPTGTQLALRQRIAFAAKALMGLFSQNAATEAFGMLAGILPGGVGFPPVRGTREFLEAYSSMPFLRACTERVATSVAAVSWHLFAGKTAPGGKFMRAIACQRGSVKSRADALQALRNQGTLTEIQEHPLLEVMNSANNYLTGTANRKLLQIYLDTVGEAFWIKERNALGVPVSVWPIPPHWVIQPPTPTNRVYRVSFRGWQGSIPDTEILWFKDADPVNPYARGKGMAQSMADELDTDEAVAKHTRRFFHNQAQPPLIVTSGSGGGFNKDTVAELEDRWTAKSRQAFWGAAKPFFLNQAVTVTEVGQTFRAMQLIDIRKFERDTILQAFGIPPELLGVLEHSNRATVAAADYIMARYVVVPRLEFIRSVLQEILVPEYDSRLIVTYDSPVQEDSAEQLQAASAAPWAITVDEWRKRIGEQEIPNGKGKVHMVPFNLTAIENPSDAVGVPGAAGPSEPKPPAGSAPVPSQ